MRDYRLAPNSSNSNNASSSVGAIICSTWRIGAIRGATVGMGAIDSLEPMKGEGTMGAPVACQGYL